MHKEYVLAIYIGERPYQIDKSNALELLQTKKWNLQQHAPNTVYKILSPYQFYLARNEAIEKLAKRE